MQSLKVASETTKAENVRSWVLYALRHVLETEKVRNSVLKAILSEQFKRVGYTPIYGKTLNNRINSSDLTAYLDKIIKQYPPDRSSKYIVLFTISNIMDAVTQETHFQTFIYVPGSNPSALIYCFDPARDCSQQPGIYYPHAIDELVEYIDFHNELPSVSESDIITVAHPQVVNACQIHDNDVFCQSWSLLLQLSGVMTLLTTGKLQDNPIIPESQLEKYSILLNFYQTILPVLCDELRKTYKSYDIPSSYKSIDPCNVIQEMKCIVNNNVINCGLCGPPDDTGVKCPEILNQQTQRYSFNRYRVHSDTKPRKVPKTSKQLKPAGRGMKELRDRLAVQKMLDSLSMAGSSSMNNSLQTSTQNNNTRTNNSNKQDVNDLSSQINKLSI